MPERSFSVRLSARVDEYVKAMADARRATQGFSDESAANLNKVGTKMQHVGSTMTKFVTIPLAALGTAAVASAISWESAWAGVTKTVDGTASELSTLQGELRGMARELPATHGEIAAVAEAAGQLGVQTESISDFTKVMLDLGATTNLSSDEAATSIAQMMNVMGTAPADVERLGSALVDLGNNGASTERDIIMMAQRISGAAKIVGLSEPEVLGLANALASVGIEVEAGGSAISNIMTDMAKAVSTGSEELGVFAQVAGQSSADFSAAFESDPADAIASFVEGLGRLDAAGGDVFGVLEMLGQSDVRVSRALLTMAGSGDLLRESLQMGRDAWQENNALTAEAAKRYETTASKMAIFRNRMVDMFIEIADVALPVLNSIMDFAGDAADAFATLPGPVQGTAIGFLALAAAAGPLIYIGGSLIRNLRDIRAGLIFVKTTLAEAGISATAAGIAFGVFAGVVVAAAAAFVAYRAFTAEQREVTARAKEVAAALDGATDAARENATATDEVSITYRGLANALTSTGEDGKKLTTTLSLLGLSVDDTIKTLTDVKNDPVNAMAALAEGMGVGADRAQALAKIVNDFDKWGTISAGIDDAGLGDLENMARLLEELQDQSEKNDFNKIISEWITADAALSPLNQTLLATAKAQAAAAGAGDDWLPVLEIYNDLKANVDESGGSVKGLSAESARLAAQAQAAGVALDPFGHAIGVIGVEAEATMTKTSDMTDAVDAATSIFNDAKSAASGYSDAISMVFDPTANLTKSTETLYKTMDALRSGIKDNGKSLDIATKKGQDNRANVDAQVTAIKAQGAALRATGSTAEEAGYSMELLRQDLIKQMGQMGFNRTAAEEYIAQLGLTPDSIATAITLDHATETAAQIEDIKDDLGELDEADATEIDMLVESGDLDGALLKLLELQRIAALGADFVITTTGSVPTGANMRAFAAGDVVDRATIGIFGEAGAEVILPLTNPGRMADLLNDPRVGPKVMSALGFMKFANGGVVGSLTASDGVMSTILNSGPKKASTSGDSLDSIKSNMHETGALSDSDYRAYLATRLGDFEQYSDEWTSVWRDIKGLDDDEAKRQADQAQAAKDAASAEVEAEDQKYAAMYELGAISQAQYEAYLQSRLGSFEIYSADWMTRWRELSGIQEQAEKDAQDRAEQQAKDAQARLDILFNQAENRRGLVVAERTLGESWSDLGEAQAAVGAAKDDKELASANERVASAINRVADDAIDGAEARAKANGLVEGTPGWANFMRSEVGTYAAQHPELSGRLNEWLAGVPRFANGAYMPSQPGGVLGVFAEAGQAEWALPDDRLKGLLVSAASMGVAQSRTSGGGDGGGGWQIHGGINVGKTADLPDVKEELRKIQWRARLKN